MDIETAKQHLKNYSEASLSKRGEAIEVLLREYGTYHSISKEFNLSEKTLQKMHRITQLPTGIQWKVNEGNISLEHAWYISRLDNEDDQWLLAFIIIEEKIGTKECKEILYAVLKYGHPLKKVLETRLGIRCDRIHHLLIPLPFQLRLDIARMAWSKKLDWEDFCYKAICQNSNVEVGKIANQIKELIETLEKSRLF